MFVRVGSFCLALVLLMGGCPPEDPTIPPSDSATPGPDGAPETADTGFPTPPEPEPTSVELFVQRGGEPVPDVLVYVTGRDGKLAAELTTGLDGRATVDPFPEGGAVTIQEFSESANFRTMFGVVAGDRLVFGRGAMVDTEPQGNVTLTIPALASDVNQMTTHADCSISGSVGGLQTSGTVPLFGGDCVPGPVRGMVLNPSPAKRVLAYAYGEGTLSGTRPSLTETIAVGPWSTEMGTITLQLPKPRVDESFFGYGLADFGVETVEIGNFESGAEPVPPVVDRVTVFGDRDIGFTTFGLRREVVATPDVGGNVDVVMERSDFLAPRTIEGSATEVPPSVGAGEQPLSSCGGIAIDAFVGQVAIGRSNVVPAFGGEPRTYGSWNFLAPASTEVFVLPELPAEAPAWPTEGALREHTLRITAVAFEDASFDDIRALEDPIGQIRSWSRVPPAWGDACWSTDSRPEP